MDPAPEVVSAETPTAQEQAVTNIVEDNLVLAPTNTAPALVTNSTQTLGVTTSPRALVAVTTASLP